MELISGSYRRLQLLSVCGVLQAECLTVCFVTLNRTTKLHFKKQNSKEQPAVIQVVQVAVVAAVDVGAEKDTSVTWK